MEGALREWVGLFLAAAMALLAIGRWVGTRERRDREAEEGPSAATLAQRIDGGEREHAFLFAHVNDRFARLDTEIARLQSPRWVDELQVKIGTLKTDQQREGDLLRQQLRDDLAAVHSRIARIERKVFDGAQT